MKILITVLLILASLSISAKQGKDEVKTNDLKNKCVLSNACHLKIISEQLSDITYMLQLGLTKRDKRRYDQCWLSSQLTHDSMDSIECPWYCEKYPDKCKGKKKEKK